MKSGMPWSLRGIDEETREAIYKAARRAGLTVNEWLDQNVGGEDSSETPETSGDNPTAIAAALDRLTARLRSMDDRSRATVPNLIRRLDEIDQRLALHAEGGRTGRSLKGVSAMVQKLARDIEDADERARTMIEGRRPAGTVQPAADVKRVTDAIRDLDQRIARMGERTAPPPQEPAPALDDIGTRLNALLADRPEPAATRVASIDAALRGLEARIDEAKARLIRPAEPATSGQFGLTDRRPSEPPGRSRTQPTPPASEPAGKGDDLAAAIAEISAHQRRLDEHAETLAMRRDQKALSAAMAALRADIAALTDQVAALSRNGAEDQGATFDLARRIEALSSERPIDRSLLSAVRTDLAALREMVARNAAAPSLEQIDETIASRLDEIARKTNDHNRLDALSEEVSELRRALEADDSPRAVQRLEMRVAELGRSVEAALGRKEPAFNPAIERLEGQLVTLGEELKVALANHNAAVASQEAVERLEQRLDSLSHNIAATLSERSTPSVVGRLDEIAARIDDLLDRTPAVSSLATMHARLQSLVESVEGLSASQHEPTAALDEIKAEIAAIRRDIAGRGAADTDHLEGQIRELAARLETATRSDSGATGMAELEAQVARLASQLEDDQPRTAALRQIEDGLAQLQSRLSESHRESIEAARAEARAAVNDLSSSLDKGGISADLIRALRQDLDNLRTATEEQAPSAATEPKAVDQTLTRVVDRLDQLERATVVEDRGTGTHGAPAWTLPGSAEAMTAPQRAATGDRRADFIAAARRAAQAAAAEAHKGQAQPRPEPSEDADHKGGAFARISQAIRNRKRPLLLAAAAIILAIGALKVYGTVGSGDAVLQHVASAPSAVTAAAPKSTADDVAAPTGIVAPTAVNKPAALVPPTATPNTAIAFSAPEGVDTQFSATPDAPAASAFAAQSATAATAKPVALTAAPTLPTTQAAGATSGPDPAIGSPKLVQAAASGDPAAAFEVAARYAAGDNVAKDLGKAAEWYQRAAESGVAVAQYRLGSLYERGQGVAKDLTKAADWYQRAADLGNVNAMHNLAVLMSEGVDGTPDQQKALQWFEAAANYGVRDSQYNLGVIYARGLGTHQDLVSSYKWFAIGAAQGDSDAAARRDEVAKLLPQDDLAKARAAVAAWHAKPPLADANSVHVPQEGWDTLGQSIADTDRAALVKKIQTLLAEQGFDPGPADGVDGAKTRDAVKAYQHRNGIAETGKIDDPLVAALTDRRT